MIMLKYGLVCSICFQLVGSRPHASIATHVTPETAAPPRPAEVRTGLGDTDPVLRISENKNKK